MNSPSSIAKTMAPTAQPSLWSNVRLGLAVATICVSALIVLPLHLLTLSWAYNFWRQSWIAPMARLVLRIVGVKLIFEGRGMYHRQVIYFFNHSSNLDTTIVAALGIPKCRTFCSVEVLKILPHSILAWASGAMFIPSQWDHDRRVRTFKRMEKHLGRGRDSLLTSPEGSRICTGEIGRFNRGVVHLATRLKLPIVPVYFHINREDNPWMSMRFRPCTVRISFLPEIPTADWKEDDVDINKERVRDIFVDHHERAHRTNGKRIGDVLDLTMGQSH